MIVFDRNVTICFRL